ncbi:MAG: ThuA domain-containing protein [Flavobacteriaceae bacterium]
MDTDILDVPEPSQNQILVFTKTVGFRHESIEDGVTALQKLADEQGYKLTTSENALDFTLDNLKNYQLVIFLSTTGDVLNGDQQRAFEGYVQQGGAYMGIHAASDTEHDWPWYGNLVGGYFRNHPQIQNATIQVKIANHPATSHLGSTWERLDEWYNFDDLSQDTTILLNLDETTYQGGTHGENHPISWYHEFDGGRSFYTGGGHTKESFTEPDFIDHLQGGIEWCLEK